MELHFFSILAVYAASVLGAMGLGGGSLLMLYLLFFTDLPQQEAQALNLFLFLPTAALSAVLHRKNGLLQGKILKQMLPAGIIGSLIGAALSAWLPSHLLKKIFGLFLLFMGSKEALTLYREQKLSPKA